MSSYCSSAAPRFVPAVLLVLLVCLTALPARVEGTVWVNELLANSGPEDDWLELWNDADVTVDLSGFIIRDADGTEPSSDPVSEYEIPQGTTIGPKGYLVFFGAQLGFGFKDKGGSEAAALYTPSLVREDSVNYVGSPTGVTIIRYVISTGADKHPIGVFPTRGAANSYPRVMPVVISEINFQPADGDFEWIKLTNTSPDVQETFNPLYPNNPAAKWQVDGIQVGNYRLPFDQFEPNESVYLTNVNAATFKAKYNHTERVFGPYGGILNDSGESISLLRPDEANNQGTFPLVPLDTVKYAPTAPWYPSAAGGGDYLVRRSLVSYGDDPLNWAVSSDVNYNACSGGCDPSSFDQCLSHTCVEDVCSFVLDRTTPGFCASSGTPTPSPAPTPGAGDCVLSDWTDVGTCSAQCGPGMQTQTRTIEQEANGGAACPPSEERTRQVDCNLSPCDTTATPTSNTPTPTTTTAPTPTPPTSGGYVNTSLAALVSPSSSLVVLSLALLFVIAMVLE